METPLTETLDIAIPVLGAPMAGTHSESLYFNAIQCRGKLLPSSRLHSVSLVQLMGMFNCCRSIRRWVMVQAWLQKRQCLLYTGSDNYCQAYI